MSTNADVVSRVVNGLRALSKDTHVSQRYILSIAKTKARFLMSQKLDEMTLFKESGLISVVDCFPLEPVGPKDCGIVEFESCSSVMRSCKKLPEGLFGKNGSGIINVFNMDESKEYVYITPRGYFQRKDRKYKRKNSSFFTIADGRLLLLDSKNEMVRLFMIALDKDEANSLSECSPKDNHKSKWESEFVCPDRFLDLVIRDTITEVANFYRTTPVDENPNLDENQKSQTVR